MSLTKGSQLAALNWAAERAGMSYGRFVLTLDDKKREALYKEYETYLKARETEETAQIRAAMKPEKAPAANTSEVPIVDTAIDTLFAGSLDSLVGDARH